VTSQTLPPHTLPTLSKPWTPGAGLTIELWLAAHARAQGGTNLLQAGPGVTLNVTRDAWPGRRIPQAHGLTLTLSDGKQVRLRVRVEITGWQKGRIVGKSQSVLMMINPIISTRTRKHQAAGRARDPLMRRHG
jgi:hypothetical protein